MWKRIKKKKKKKRKDEKIYKMWASLSLSLCV